MSTQQEHARFIKENSSFTVDCSHAIFSKEELEILVKYGHWFTALTKGVLEPITEMQKELILVANHQKQPDTVYEKAWFKYLGRTALEVKDQFRTLEQYQIEEDTFYSRSMVKHLRKMMTAEMGKNHRF